MNKVRACIFCFVAIVVAGGVMLTGCASSKGTSTQGGSVKDAVGLLGDWKLTSVLRSGSELSIPEDVTITLSTDIPVAGSYTYDVSGFSGVNNYSGPMTVEGNAYTGGPFAITMMMGSPELSEFERLYLETLTDADVINIAADGHGMEIAKSSGETALLFDRLKFDGTDWILTGYYNGTGVRSVDQSQPVPELSFGTKMDISGFSGSNFVMGDYSVDYNTRTVTFQNIETASVVAFSEIEKIYLDLLKKSNTYVWNGDSLTLVDKAGTTVLVFATK